MKQKGIRTTYIGEVVSDRMDKTRIVQITKVIRYGLYEKIIRRRKKFAVDDKLNRTGVGDIVLIAETRPLSKTKYWKILKVIKKAVSEKEPEPAEKAWGDNGGERISGK